MNELQIVTFLTRAAAGGLAGILLSLIAERCGWFQKLDSNKKLLVVVVVCLAPPPLATAALQFVPAEVWAMLNPYFQSLAAGVAALLASQWMHRVEKNAQERQACGLWREQQAGENYEAPFGADEVQRIQQYADGLDKCGEEDTPPVYDIYGVQWRTIRDAATGHLHLVEPELEAGRPCVALSEEFRKATAEVKVAEPVPLYVEEDRTYRIRRDPETGNLVAVDSDSWDEWGLGTPMTDPVTDPPV